MHTLISEGKSELIVNKSKFIGYSVIANSREGFLARVMEIKLNNSSSIMIVFKSSITSEVSTTSIAFSASVTRGVFFGLGIFVFQFLFYIL